MVQAYEGLPLKNLEDTRLREVDKQLFNRHKDKMPERFSKRVQHFYSECERVNKGVEAWKKGDIATFGQLMFESCESSVNNYECGSLN